MQKKSPYSAILNPPCDIELEKVVLGCFIMSSESVKLHLDSLKSPDVFYFNNHKIIYSAIQELYQMSMPIDIITLTLHLQKTNKLNKEEGISPFYLTELTVRIGSTSNLPTYIALLLELYMKRATFDLSQKTTKKASDPTTDAFKLVEEIEKETSYRVNLIMLNSEKLPDKLIVDFFEQIEKAQNNDGSIIGIPSGISDLDAMTNGFQPANLYLCGARPAMGKTGFLLSLIRNAVILTRKPVCIFSLEMSARELMGRLLAMHTGVSSLDALAGKVNDDYFVKGYEFSSILYKDGQPLLIIDDTASLNIFDIKARAKRYAEKYGIAEILLDYVQLAVRSSASQEQVKRELSIIGKGLKEISKDLNVPVIALSQLNRDVEKTPTKRPELQHLRDSGTLEEDADMVMFLYRKEYYWHLTKKEEFKEMEVNGQFISSEGYGEIIVAKYRHGAVGSIFCEYISHTTEWQDMDGGLNLSSYLANHNIKEH